MSCKDILTGSKYTGEIFIALRIVVIKYKRFKPKAQC